MFPQATLAPPIPVRDANGALFIPGWVKIDGRDAFYVPDDGSNAGFFQIIRQNDGFNVDSFFDLLLQEAELERVDRPQGIQAEAFSATFGPMVAAVFGRARHEGQAVSFFADLHGPDDENKVRTRRYLRTVTRCGRAMTRRKPSFMWAWSILRSCRSLGL